MDSCCTYRVAESPQTAFFLLIAVVLYLGTSANALGDFFSSFQIPKDFYVEVHLFCWYISEGNAAACKDAENLDSSGIFCKSFITVTFQGQHISIH